MENSVAREKRPFKSIGRRLSVSTAIACAVVALLATAYCYSAYRRKVVEGVGAAALGIAQTVAATIDGDQYKASLARGEKDRYWDQVKTLLEQIHDDTKAIFVYTFSYGTPDQYQYYATAKYNVEVGFTQPKHHFAAEAGETLATGAYTQSPLYDAGYDAYAYYGRLISGFAPIRDSQGAVVGAVGVDFSGDDAIAAAQRFLYSLLSAIAFLCAALGGFTLWRTRRIIMNPLADITAASEHLARGQTELSRLPLGRNDEIGVLARHFNEVARAVNSLTVGFIGSAEGQRRRQPESSPDGASTQTSHVPTAGLSGKYLATAQGINMVLTILDTLDSMVYVVDPATHRLIFYSNKFCEYYGIDREHAWTKKCWEVVGRDEVCPRCDIPRLRMMNESFPSCDREEFDEKTGSWLWIKSRLIHWFDGRVVYLSEGRDINEQKRWQEQQAAHEQELRKSTLAAQEASRMKTAFLANMSHEIRTPLNGVIGFAELAMEEPGTPGKTREFLSKITDSGESLLQLINDILDVSKIETGKMELERIPFSVGKVFELCETICQPKALEKGIELHFTLDAPTDGRFEGDPLKLRQVLLNLISNALKFTAKGTGVVTVFCRINERLGDTASLFFEVRDNGIGMSSEQVNNVFKPFTQADSSITRKYGGTGLGLSISRSLIDMMGGEIQVESAPGIGSAFSFTVPVRILDKPVGGEEKPDAAVIHSRPVFDGEALVCEDNQINREVIEEHLLRVGLRPVLAENGEIGVEFVKARMETDEPPFSVIFMDIHMPRMDGIEATRILRRMHVRSPIIALTANVMATERERYLAEGMADCLGKPFSAKTLWQCLAKFLDPVKLEDAAADPDFSPNPPNGVVNRAVGLAHAAHDPVLYARQLRLFAEEQHDFIPVLEVAVADGDRKKARRHAHTLKGVAAMIGASALSASAAKLETYLAEDRNAMAGEKYEALSVDVAGKLDRVLSEIDAQPEPDAAIPVDTVPENHVDKARAASLLGELLPLLRTNDAQALDFTNSLREVFGGRANGAGVLLERLEDYDFEAAAVAAERLLADLSD